MGPHRSALLSAALLCLLALCCAAPAFALEPAGGGWYWQSPQPQGNVLNAVTFADPLNVWAVGDSGTIVHSADAGVTWQRVPCPATVPLGSVTFSGTLQGWAAGGYGWDSMFSDQNSSGVILHTADGGATWNVQMSLSDRAVSDLAFVDDQVGWAVGRAGLILHTSDGGKTWVRQTSVVKRALVSVAFADAQHGYAAGAAGILLKTVDGGATWRRISTRTMWGPGVGSLALGPDGRLWAVMGGRGVEGDFPKLAWSSNGGRTWRLLHVGDDDASIWDIIASRDGVYAVGPMTVPGGARSSQVLVSHDDGASWTRHVVGASVRFNAIAKSETGVLCAVGDMTATSGDDGADWSGRQTHAAALGSVDMVGQSEAWAVGASTWPLLNVGNVEGSGSTSLLHTRDGVRWVEQYVHAGEYFDSVDFADASHGWAVGDKGLIRHTVDGGTTWSLQSGGTTAVLGQVVATSADAAWVAGIRRSRLTLTAEILRTTDAGATWTSVVVPENVYPLSLAAISGDDAWIGGVRRVRSGYQAVSLFTVDGGATWTPIPLPSSIGASSVPFAVDFIDAEHGWCSTVNLEDASCAVLATQDGGKTWTLVSQPGIFGRDIIMDVDFVDAANGWASGTAIYRTTDGGQTWAREVSGGDESEYLVSGFDSTHALATGSGVLTTVDSAGDTAAPVTLIDEVGGWIRRDFTPRLSAADVGTSGLASTEYAVDGGAWTQGLTPPPFLAPPDHSGDGSHVLQYLSTDMAGNVEPLQAVAVHIDTVRPVIRLRRCVMGRDGVLRLHLRIDDASCPSVDRFAFNIRSMHGGVIGSASFDGSTLRTNRWVTMRDSDMSDWLNAGRYRLTFSASDRAGNRPTRHAHAVLLVKRHRRHPLPGGGSGGGSSAGGASSSALRRSVTRATHGADQTAETPQLIEDLRRLVAGLTGAR